MTLWYGLYILYLLIEEIAMWIAEFSDNRPNKEAKTKRALLDEIGAWSARKSSVTQGEYIVDSDGYSPQVRIYKRK